MIAKRLRFLSADASVEQISRGILWMAVLLSFFGVVMVFAATYLSSLQQSGRSWGTVAHQMMWLVLGVVIFIFASKITPERLRRFAPTLLIGAFGLLGAVLIPGVGRNIGGSSRWLVVGPLQVQPSEIAKLVLVIYLARVLTTKDVSLGFRRRTLPALTVIGAMALFVIVEPDMGTSMLLCVAGVGMLIGSGTRLSELVLSGLGITLVGAYLAFAKPYRRARMLSFLHPWLHRASWSYQEVQSLAAFATGHLGGVGLGAGQTSYNFLPNAQTDFIFAVVGQDLGLFGAVALLAVLFGLVLLLVRAARKVSNPMNSLFCFGVAAWIGGQIVLNIGAVEGLLPVTGVPLPLVSAGGSSTVIIFAALGLIRGALLKESGDDLALQLAVHSQRTKPTSSVPFLASSVRLFRPAGLQGHEGVRGSRSSGPYPTDEDLTTQFSRVGGRANRSDPMGASRERLRVRGGRASKASVASKASKSR